MAKKILIVDDSALIRQQVRRTLAGAGFAVAEASDGLDALAQLRVGTEDIHLVISDVNMPRMGGLELLEQIRQHEELAALPFVILTTEAQADLVLRSRALNARGWLMKPVKPEILLALARTLGEAAA